MLEGTPPESAADDANEVLFVCRDMLQHLLRSSDDIPPSEFNAIRDLDDRLTLLEMEIARRRRGSGESKPKG